MFADMEAKRQRIDEALAHIQNDMRVHVSGIGDGKIVCIFAYSIAVRVRLATGQVIDTTAFELTPLEEEKDAQRNRKPDVSGTRSTVHIDTSTE